VTTIGDRGLGGAVAPRSAGGWWRTRRGRRRLADAAGYAVLAPLTLAIAFPFLWVLASALRPRERLYEASLVPGSLTLEHFAWALSQRAFVQPLRNTVLVAAATAALSLVLATLAAHSLTAYPYRGKRGVLGALLLVNLLPSVLLVVPVFLLVRGAGLYDTLTGLVLVLTTLGAPAATLLLRSIFLGVPRDLLDAAMLDGASRIGTLWRIVLPLSRPGLMVAAMSSVVLVWNDVLYALVLTRDVSTQTIGVALTAQAQAQFSIVNWSGILAEGVLVTLPVVLAFAALQRHFVPGNAMSGLR
jgi:multiple sugar transport system permease protein